MKKIISYYEKLKMIDDVKRIFEKELEGRMSLIKVPSPLFVKSDSGLQDNLSGVEKAVSFVKDDEKYEVVHSLAKWKRESLGKYHFELYQGLYTNMKAIRKDEKVDNLHSLYVEQWDWERIIRKEDRTIDYLKDTVKTLYKTIRHTVISMRKKYPFLTISLPKSIYFITSEELEKRYPDLISSEREEMITKEKKAVFIIGIGDKLSSGVPHDKRSPDYDDWQLNGDMLFYDKIIDKPMEITSMGIRVDKDSLISQLKKSGCEYRLSLPYHQKICDEKLPYTIGGGIGESRLIMFILERKHIAEVNASFWDKATSETLQSFDIL